MPEFFPSSSTASAPNIFIWLSLFAPPILLSIIPFVRLPIARPSEPLSFFYAFPFLCGRTSSFHSVFLRPFHLYIWPSVYLSTCFENARWEIVNDNDLLHFLISLTLHRSYLSTITLTFRFTTSFSLRISQKMVPISKLSPRNANERRKTKVEKRTWSVILCSGSRVDNISGLILRAARTPWGIFVS